MAEAGYSQDKSSLIRRLKRIEGHTRGCLRVAIARNQGDEAIDELLDVLTQFLNRGWHKHRFDRLNHGRNHLRRDLPCRK